MIRSHKFGVEAKVVAFYGWWFQGDRREAIVQIHHLCRHGDGKPYTATGTVFASDLTGDPDEVDAAVTAAEVVAQSRSYFRCLLPCLEPE